jgi:hypothetical protein
MDKVQKKEGSNNLYSSRYGLIGDVLPIPGRKDRSHVNKRNGTDFRTFYTTEVLDIEILLLGTM